MRYKEFNVGKLRAMLSERGLRERDLVKMLYGNQSRQTFKTIFTNNFGVQKLLDVCNVLNIPMDDLFEIGEDGTSLPNISGSYNNINSTVINSDIATLKSENETLKVLIKEKDSRIDDLKKSLDKILELVKMGQK